MSHSCAHTAENGVHVTDTSLSLPSPPAALDTELGKGSRTMPSNSRWEWVPCSALPPTLQGECHAVWMPFTMIFPTRSDRKKSRSW